MTAATPTAAAPRRPGYDPDPGVTARRTSSLLAAEKVVWLSTVRDDGTPHLVPTWFWWDGQALTLWSKPGALKVRNVRANPNVMVALGDPGDDFAVGLIEAAAALPDQPVRVPDAFFAKYASDLAAARLDEVSFRRTYTQVIRIEPTRFLAWRGRGERHDPVDAARGHPAALLAMRLAGLFEAAAARLRLVALRPAGMIA